MRRTCVVVEDEPDIAAVIGMSLDPARSEVVVAGTLAAGRRTPVVVLTARAAARAEAAAAGADRVMLKPFDPDQLQATVDDLAGRP